MSEPMNTALPSAERAGELWLLLPRPVRHTSDPAAAPSAKRYPLPDPKSTLVPSKEMTGVLRKKAPVAYLHTRAPAVLMAYTARGRAELRPAASQVVGDVRLTVTVIVANIDHPARRKRGRTLVKC